MLGEFPLLVEIKALVVEELELRSELELIIALVFDEGELKDNDGVEELAK